LGLVVTGDEIVALSKKHTITEYAAQDAVNPIPVARAKGVYFWTPEGKRFIDFNSQLMSVNIGHGDPRVIAAITAQAEKVTYVTPGMTTEVRARLGAKLAEITPGDIDAFFFTNGGAEANENAFKIALDGHHVPAPQEADGRQAQQAAGVLRRYAQPPEKGPRCFTPLQLVLADIGRGRREDGRARQQRHGIDDAALQEVRLSLGRGQHGGENRRRARKTERAHHGCALDAPEVTHGSARIPFLIQMPASV
jgi:4-aminobutyrate aminotransferase-like enzyme